MSDKKTERHMKSTLKILLFLPAIFSSGGIGAAEVESLHSELKELQLRRDSCYQRRDSLERLVRFHSEEVAQLKRKLSSGEFSPVEKYRLETGLRAGQILADSLDALSLTVSGLESGIAELGRRGDLLCAGAIDSLSRLLEKSSSVERVRDILRKIGEYRLLRAAFAPAGGGAYAVRARSLEGQATELTIEPGDSPEDIRDKADFFSDMADKWEGHLTLIKARIGHLDEERSIRRRIGEFAQEISLFDHGPASSRARVTSTGTGVEDQSGVDRGDQFGPEIETPLSEGLGGAEVGRDLELYDLEQNPAIAEAIESLASNDLENLLRLLKSRQDSLKADLDSLRVWERSFRLKAAEIERERKDSPQQ